MFIKSALKLLTVTLAGLSPTVATANAQKILNDAIINAIAQKKQTKKIHGPDGHRFNIRKVKVHVYNRGYPPYTVISGQLSHRRRYKTNDQYFYRLNINNVTGTVAQFSEKVKSGSGPWNLIPKPYVTSDVSSLPCRLPDGFCAVQRPYYDNTDTSWGGDARKIAVLIAQQVVQLCLRNPGSIPRYCFY